MAFLRSIFILFVLGAVSSSLLFANENTQDLKHLESVVETPHLNQTVAYTRKQRKQENLDSGKTYVRFPSTKNFQPSKSLFFQTNVGVGLLYFNGLKGNLMGRPFESFNITGTYRTAPLRHRLSYNRTALFEYLLGYRFNLWLKFAFSYQHQGGISIQSKALSGNTAPPPAQNAFIQFTSDLSLDGLLAKVYFELPFGVIWKSLSINPYLATGVGPGWQTWTQIQLTYMSGVLGNGDNNGFTGNMFFLRKKISANAVWMVDTGLQIQKASPANPFSLVIGCKYIQWGQARSIGKMSQQGAHKLALSDPIRIKNINQFAPYLGAQWNFAPASASGQSYKSKGKSLKAWLPYWAPSKEFQCPKSIWTQFNAGIGFLYFSGLRGNIMGRPTGNFAPATLWRDAPLKGRLSYNQTPLFEYLLGYRFNSLLKLAFSYQHQSGIAIQSRAVSAFPNSAGAATNVVQFTSYLSLDALLAKIYFELPFAIVWRGLSTNPYLAIGFGPGWQSWTRVRIGYMADTVLLMGRILPLRQKISANPVWMADTGLRIQGAYPNNLFSLLLGCKYNQWGQARNIGKMSQQGAHKLALAQPLRIKTIYQFAPYMGVQWNFSPDPSMGQSYKLKGKSPQVWLPYWVASSEFQCPTNIWTQFNAGIGFLYFSGLKGNLMGEPVIIFINNLNLTLNARDVPLKGRLSYNRTPLFEYLVGYQFNSWFKGALAYQYQGGVTVQTEALQGYSSASSIYAQFTSNLSLNAILAKIYFELPFAMIWRSLSTNPYLAVGVGPGWQSWTQIQVDYMYGNTNFLGEPLLLRQKISANVVWMVDVGMRIQSAYPNSKFSVLLGCKYNQWGQARSMGKMSQQEAHKVALGHPIIIKTVYQFAPYLGVQWNF